MDCWSGLVAVGYQVYAVNPMSVDRYRDQHAISGGKSDRGDAKVLADVVRTDRHNHRTVAADSELLAAASMALNLLPQVYRAECRGTSHGRMLEFTGLVADAEIDELTRWPHRSISGRTRS